MKPLQKKEYSIREVQEKLLDLLKYIDRICEENDLEYYLGYGTLIGAIRHHGFIPWDDDADIFMPRDHYLRFIEIVDKENGQYRISSLQNDPKWNHAKAKIWDTNTKIVYPFMEYGGDIGVFVDVFPMDGLSDNDAEVKRHYFWVKVNNAIRTSANHTSFWPDEKHKLLKGILRPFGRIRGARYWAQRTEKMAMKRDYRTSNRVGSTVDIGSWNLQVNYRSQYSEKLKVPFEDTMLRVPNGYDEILRVHYGDYMQIPPEDKRAGRHFFDIYSLDLKKDLQEDDNTAD